MTLTRTVVFALIAATLPLTASAVKPVRRVNLRVYRFDGVRIGDLYSRLMARAPYNRPCDNDPVDKRSQRAMVYGALPCRGHAFPLKTTVIFLLQMSRIRPYHQPIQNIAFLGGRYFKKKSNFPIQPGDKFSKIRAWFGRPQKSMYIGRRIPLRVHRFKGHIYILTRGNVVRGVVLGRMPWDPRREQWEVITEMYRKYTPKMKNPPAPATPKGLSGLCLRVWKNAVRCRKQSRLAQAMMRKGPGFKRKCEEEARKRPAPLRCLAKASCSGLIACFRKGR